MLTSNLSKDRSSKNIVSSVNAYSQFKRHNNSNTSFLTLLTKVLRVLWAFCMCYLVPGQATDTRL